MWRGNDDFVGNGHQKCIHVHSNGNFEIGKVLYMEPDWSLQDLLKAASQRLDLVPTAVRVFSVDGVEIDDCMMIEDDDYLFFSTGPNFISPENNYDNGEGSNIPKAIGGYKIGKFIGRGGFGEVRVGDHHLTGEKVALKFIPKRQIMNIDAVERTTTEIQCLAALKHENIIKFHQHIESPTHVILVFELMEGGDLYNYMRKKGSSALQSSMTEDEARHVFQQILSAVGYAHNQHICHRDLKLENILLKGPTPMHVKIADFGLSDFYRPGALVKSSCGTLSFLSPEVFKGTSNAGPPIDVWALGVILFALMCGRLPFEGPDLLPHKRPKDSVIRGRIMKCQYRIDDTLTPEAKDLVRRMLRLDPSERATIPEIFNHIWIRTNPSGVVDFAIKETISNTVIVDEPPPLLVVKSPRDLQSISLPTSMHPIIPLDEIEKDGKLFKSSSQVLDALEDELGLAASRGTPLHNTASGSYINLHDLSSASTRISSPLTFELSTYSQVKQLHGGFPLSNDHSIGTSNHSELLGFVQAAELDMNTSFHGTPRGSNSSTSSSFSLPNIHPQAEGSNTNPSSLAHAALHRLHLDDSGHESDSPDGTTRSTKSVSKLKLVPLRRNQTQLLSPISRAQSADTWGLPTQASTRGTSVTTPQAEEGHIYHTQESGHYTSALQKENSIISIATTGSVTPSGNSGKVMGVPNERRKISDGGQLNSARSEAPNRSAYSPRLHTSHSPSTGPDDKRPKISALSIAANSSLSSYKTLSMAHGRGVAGDEDSVSSHHELRPTHALSKRAMSFRSTSASSSSSPLAHAALPRKPQIPRQGRSPAHSDANVLEKRDRERISADVNTSLKHLTSLERHAETTGKTHSSAIRTESAKLR